MVNSYEIYSQNLVPNPSFEDYIGFNERNDSGWHRVQNSDTPDYFNLGKSNPFNNIFDKFIGGTSPGNGNGFIGIFCYRVQPARHIRNIREFIETPLTKSLEKDSVYRIEISMILDAESNVAIKNFGIYFSEETTVSKWDNRTLKLEPQVEFTGSFLDNTRTWIKLHSLYKAAGGEKYLVIGNFRPDRYTGTKQMVAQQKSKGKKEKWNLARKELASYYYLDYVNVEKVIMELPKTDTVYTLEEEVQPEDSLFDIDKIDIDSAIVLKNIQFEFNKSDLLPRSFPEINKLYNLMVENENMKVKIEGHTDNVGGYQFNLGLSVSRAEAVVKYLISKGIDPGRIEYDGYSYSQPLESNNTDEGRAANRRVVFKILQK